MRRWEYRFEDAGFAEQWFKRGVAREASEFQEMFDLAGEWGWELVSYEAVPVAGKIHTNEIRSYKYLAIVASQSLRAPRAATLGR